jgi:hypothetical protein
LLQELFSRIRKDLLREMKALKPGDRSAGGAARVLGCWWPVFRVCSSHGHGGNLKSLVPLVSKRGCRVQAVFLPFTVLDSHAGLFCVV